MLSALRRAEGALWVFVKARSLSSSTRGSAIRVRATVVPFSLSEVEAKKRFDDWHRTSWLAPTNLLDSDSLAVRAVYFPFWCFQTELAFTYSATAAPTEASGANHVPQSHRGSLPNECFSFENPEMQIYASYQHRRDFADVAKMSRIPESCFEATYGHHSIYGTQLEAPKVRQGMAWELALRNVRKRKRAYIEGHLQLTTGADTIQELHLSIRVLNRRAKLYYFPCYLLDYTFSRSYTTGGELQETKFQTMVGGTSGGSARGERHYSPRKARFAASLLGSSIGGSMAAFSDVSLGICVAETAFWTFITATFAGLYARYSVMFERWHQMHRLDWEHHQYAKEYFQSCMANQHKGFSDYQDWMRCDNEWRHWEELQKWNWKAQERHTWGETLWREQHQRRRDNINFKLKLEQQRSRHYTREQEERREERRRRRFGASESFHHHGVTDFAWRLNAGGNQDAFGYYALLSLEPTGVWTEKEIKEAFQREALRWHPDRHAVGAKRANGELRDRKEMRERFQSLREAYEVLKDPKKKKLYDQGRLLRDQL